MLQGVKVTDGVDPTRHSQPKSQRAASFLLQQQKNCSLWSLLGQSHGALAGLGPWETPAWKDVALKANREGLEMAGDGAAGDTMTRATAKGSGHRDPRGQRNARNRGTEIKCSLPLQLGLALWPSETATCDTSIPYGHWLLTQLLPTNVSGKAADPAWVLDPCTHMADLGGAPGFALAQHQAFRYLEEDLFFFYTNSAFEINTP